jgi:Zn-dependent M16 (insulinase) family peptidase
LGIPDDAKAYVMSLPDENKMALIAQMRKAKEAQKGEAESKDGKETVPQSKTYTVDYYINKLRKNKVHTHTHSLSLSSHFTKQFTSLSPSLSFSMKIVCCELNSFING